MASGDAVVTVFTVNLNAQSGNVYTVTLQCEDALGGISTKSVTVSVP